MRYVLVDLEAAVRGRYGSEAAVHRALQRVEAGGQVPLSDLCVLTYEGGRVSSSVRADELLAALRAHTMTLTDWSVAVVDWAA